MRAGLWSGAWRAREREERNERNEREEREEREGKKNERFITLIKLMVAGKKPRGPYMKTHLCVLFSVLPRLPLPECSRPYFVHRTHSVPQHALIYYETM